jgi:hypothetical protein
MRDRLQAHAGAASTLRSDLGKGLPPQPRFHPLVEGNASNFPTIKRVTKLVHGLDSRTNRGGSTSACLCKAGGFTHNRTLSENTWVFKARPQERGISCPAPTGRWLVFCCSMDAPLCGCLWLPTEGRSHSQHLQLAICRRWSILPAAEPATVIPNETNGPNTCTSDLAVNTSQRQTSAAMASQLSLLLRNRTKHQPGDPRPYPCRLVATDLRVRSQHGVEIPSNHVREVRGLRKCNEGLDEKQNGQALGRKFPH